MVHDCETEALRVVITIPSSLYVPLRGNQGQLRLGLPCTFGVSFEELKHIYGSTSGLPHSIRCHALINVFKTPSSWAYHSTIHRLVSNA
jgi:hypothetical protein